jgi:predicted kinase
MGLDKAPLLLEKESSMKTFQDFIDEGVNDPGIFKAFFTAGGPGSGKSYVASASGAGKNNPYGLKIVDSDPLFTKMLKDAGMATTVKDIYSDEGQAIRDRAKTLITKQEKSYIEGRLGLLIDGTGKDYNKIKKSSDTLKKIGYDTYMIFVNTSLDIALQQNQDRARKLKDEVIRRTWEEVQGIKDGLANLFPGGFVEIVNNRAGEDVFRKAFVEVGKLIKTPPNKPAAKMWIAHELEQKKR